MSHPIVREPRWPAFVAMLAAAGVYLALPEPLSVGPSWLLLAVILVLLIPIVVSNLRGYYQVARILTFAANGVITAALVASLAILIHGLPQHREPPNTLLRSASTLWITNVLVFALWYWKLDAGGPLRRDHTRGCLDSSFLFPQMLTPDGRESSVVAQFYGLPVSRLQHQHRFLADRHRGPVALGESGHDAAVIDFVDNSCPAGRASGQYSVSCLLRVFSGAGTDSRS